MNESIEKCAYLDVKLTDKERAVDLVSRMTSEEKYSQLTAMTAPAIPRLGVNAYNWWSEALHGVARDGEATSFPTGLGIAATWNPELVKTAASAMSDEAREKFNSRRNDHGLNYWSPTINMDRDPRWGRAEETYGEDPYLCGSIAEAFVGGFQCYNADEGRYKALSTVKHFLANNSEQNRHNGSSNVDERDLHEYYTEAFRRAIERAGASSVMTSYNAVNGVPMSVNKPILDGLLRRTWGFGGFVVTDCSALYDVSFHHSWRPDGWGDKPWGEKETAAYAILAGIDLNCGVILAPHTGRAVDAGLLNDRDVDKALVRLFTARMSTGEFDPDGGIFGGGQYAGMIHSEAHKKLAEDMADEAVVMLENDGMLPLSGNVKNLVVIGRLAGEVTLGDYSTDAPINVSTPVDGITAALLRANPDAKITYIPGSDSGSGRFLMNLKNISLLDAAGDKIGEIDLTKCAETSACRVDRDGSIGFASAGGCRVKFGAGSIDFGKAAKFSAQMSGDGGVPPTRIEIRAGDPVNGPLLGTVDGEGSTGGWKNYKRYDFNAATGGGYTSEDIYIVMTKVPTSIEFSEQEKAQIRDADAVVFFAGTRPGENGYFEETDGYTLDLPNRQSEMINRAAELNKNIAVYIQAVSEVNVEKFRDSVRAILWSTYNGQAQGNAAGRILFGEANPSGKLPFTWYMSVDDLADIKDYTIRPNAENKGRSYRYFTGDVAYPFGYGLSYAKFEYSNLKINRGSVTPNDKINVTFDVENVGKTCGGEVAQMYVASPNADGNGRPKKRLKGFKKVFIEAGEKASVTLELDASDLWYWDSEKACETFDEGKYTIEVGADSRACESMTAEFELKGALKKQIFAVTAIPNGHVMSLSKNERLKTELTASCNDQSFVDLKTANVEFSITDESVATVDEAGFVTPVGEGIATVTASVTFDGKTKTDSFAVKVTA